MEFIWVGVGGFAGANLRYLLGSWVTARVMTPWPLGTFLVNLSGSLLIGILLTAFIDHAALDPLWRRLLVVGFLGGYTTFSSYTFEAITLFEQGDWRRALLYVLGSNLLGLLACALGIVIARGVWK